MRAVIILIISLAAFLVSNYYISLSLTQDGEYKASLYVINDDVTRIDIVSNISEGHFVSHSYLSSPGLDGTALFLSEGTFIDDDDLDYYSVSYKMSQLDKPNVLDADKASLYINMVGRLGHPVNEKIKMLYHNKKVNIFDMNRNNSIIMYVRSN